MATKPIDHGEEMGEPAYLRNLKAYIKDDPTQDHLTAIETEMFNGPDRGAAVVLTAIVERSLEHLIKRELRPEGVNDLFQFNGPVGTLSNKIKMAYSLKLLGSKTKHDLEIIRALRNVFAHSRLPVTFDTDAIKTACENLYIPDLEGVQLNSHMLDKVSEDRLADAVNIQHPRTRFFTACNEIAKRIYFLRAGEGPNHYLNELP